MRDQNLVNELRPCPFCGGRAAIVHKKEPVGECWKVYCMNEDCWCEASTPAYNRRETAVEAWNRRADNG